MCESKKDIPIIRVGRKTNEAKYDFLRLYYTTWNFITKTRPRVIVDTHAGSGLVEYIGDKDITSKRLTKRMYGSPLLAILKTLNISKNLTIILNEPDKNHYNELEKHVEDFKENGVPIFVKEKEKFYYKSLESRRKRSMKTKAQWEYPESPEDHPPKGYEKTRLFSDAESVLYNEKIENIIDDLISTHLSPVMIKDKIFDPIALFLVDPCGVVGFRDVISKICRRAQKQEGTELILNWSWDAIARNLNTKNRDGILSKVYGIPLDQIKEEFKGIESMEQYLKKYINLLKEDFHFVNNVGVPRDRKFKPKQSTYRKYYLLFCTNNESGISLAGYKTRKIKKAMRDFHETIDKFFDSQS